MIEPVTSSDMYLTKSRAIAARVIGGEAIIMSAVDSTLFSLNPMGTIIWQKADGRTPLSEIAENICADFDVSLDEAQADGARFAAELVQHGLLEVSPTPISS